MKRFLPALLGIFLVFFIFSVFIFRKEPVNVSAAPATHLVISEVQVAGAFSTNDFSNYIIQLHLMSAWTE